MLEREKGVFPLRGSLWYNGGKDDLMQRITGVKNDMAKKKPLKKDRKNPQARNSAAVKKPFYLEATSKQRQPKPKKGKEFGDGWEIVDPKESAIEPGEYQAECFALDEDGNGLVRIQGKKLSVSGVLPGEVITAEVGRGKRPRAKLVRVQQASPDRVSPRCKVFGICGGCRLQHLSYDAQLAWKQERVERLMKEYVEQGARFYQILGMQEPWRYRNKSHATFGINAKKQIVSGIYEENSHRVVAVDRCMIQDEKADEIVRSIRQIMKSCKLLPYDEDNETGLLRHVLIRRGFASGEIMVVLVTASMVFPGRSKFVGMLREQHPEITTIVMNCNPKHTSMVLGDQERVLYGKGWIEDVLCGKRFAISPHSFYQVNPKQTELLYQRAMQMAQLTGTERVLDAYCGIGTISLIAADHAKEVIGVELNRDAVRDAVNNAKRNGVTNARFFCGDAGEFMTGMAERGEQLDVVVMDPPRSGSDEAFLNSVCRLQPEKVVYISCDPQTQKRDLQVLVRGGYQVCSIQPVDLFPQTAHCENICLLSRIGKNK